MLFKSPPTKACVLSLIFSCLLILNPVYAANYLIDFDLDPPKIERINDQKAVITGKVLNRNTKIPTDLSYQIEINLQGGPASHTDFSIPERASRGQTRFSDNQQPQFSQLGGKTSLIISLLGRLGEHTDALGTGLSFYRDPSSLAELSLSIGDQYELSQVRYTLTGLDLLLSPACTLNTVPDQPLCEQSFIDRVVILSSGGRNAYAPAVPNHLTVVGDTITASFTDTNNNGYPDTPEDKRVATDAFTGNIEVFHPTAIGNRLSLQFKDAGFGTDLSKARWHDFGANAQVMGLASGIEFDAEAIPQVVSPAKQLDPNSASITGNVFLDVNQNQVYDPDEQGLAETKVTLYPADGSMRELIQTVTDAHGHYELKGIQADATYRLETQIKPPLLLEGHLLNPLRLIRSLELKPKQLAQQDFAAWPYALSQPKDDDLLLPDLTPLTAYPVPKEQAAAVQNEIKQKYPGMEQWYLDTQSQPGKVLMRFGTLALNQGTGPMHILGGNTQGKERPVFQRVYNRLGGFLELPVGIFAHHDAHDHVHMAAFETYRLRAFQSDAIVASSDKVSFCLTDVLWSIRPELTQQTLLGTLPQGWSCGAYEQSINVGFSDYYGPAIPDQWIDVSAVPDGQYWIEVEVNPQQKLRESNYSNNRVRLAIQFDNPLR